MEHFIHNLKTLLSQVHKYYKNGNISILQMSEKHQFITFKFFTYLWEGGWEHGQFLLNIDLCKFFLVFFLKTVYKL